MLKRSKAELSEDVGVRLDHHTVRLIGRRLSRMLRGVTVAANRPVS